MWNHAHCKVYMQLYIMLRQNSIKSPHCLKLLWLQSILDIVYLLLKIYYAILQIWQHLKLSMHDCPCLFVSACLSLPVCPCLFLCVCVCVCQSLCLSVSVCRVCLGLSVCVCMHVSVCMCACLVHVHGWEHSRFCVFYFISVFRNYFMASKYCICFNLFSML